MTSRPTGQTTARGLGLGHVTSTSTLYLSIPRSIDGGRAFSTLEIWSCVFQSREFHPCALVPCFPVPSFPPMRFGPTFSSPAFSTLVFFMVPRFPVPRCQRPRFIGKFAVKSLLTILPQHTTLCICCATLPCETLMPENKQLTINYKVVYLHILL